MLNAKLSRVDYYHNEGLKYRWRYQYWDFDFAYIQSYRFH